MLDERPNDVVDIFEDVSKETKRSQFVSEVDTVQNKIDRSTEVALCQIQEKLFKVTYSTQLVSASYLVLTALHFPPSALDPSLFLHY